MSSQPSLTPERLTYYGFKHSQGAYFNQLGIFRHVLITANIEPNLDPTPEEQRRYARYLDNSKGTHINPRDPGESKTIEEVVRGEFDNIKEERKKNGDRWELDRRETSLKLAGCLLQREFTILDLEQPWANYGDGKNVEKRAVRLAHRVRDGQASFLFYYGRDGNNAGAEPLNLMYSDIWAHIAQPSNELRQTVDRHHELVQKAEEAFL